jgi:hypothetical protein
MNTSNDDSNFIVKLFDIKQKNNKSIKIIINSDNDNPVIIKKILQHSSSLNNLSFDLSILPKEKIYSPYFIEKNKSILDILDISSINNNELVVKKNYLTIKNRSFSCESLLNFNVVKETLYRGLYNKFLSFHNFVNK